jgi:hypothetical protein
MATELETYKNTLAAMMKIMSILAYGHSQEGLFGRAVNRMMYLTGEKIGKVEGQKMDRTSDLQKALDMIMEQERGVWVAKLWKNEEEKDYFYEENGTKRVRMVFLDCPIRQVCLAHGTEMNGVFCQIAHGLFGGVLESIMGQKAALTAEHTGPNACKKVLEFK